MNDERVRLFVALELPEAVREELARWCAAAIARTSGLRLLRPQDLHVTLCFLGWRGAGEIEQIAEACRRVSGLPCPMLRVGEPIWLPPRRPRVLAVELEDAQSILTRVQSELSVALHAGGWYVPESRPFMAHVTVARLSKGARAPTRRLKGPPTLGFPGSRVTLYRSRLTSGGARYEPLETCELGSPSAAAPLDPPSSSPAGAPNGKAAS